MGFFDKIKAGLTKTREALSDTLGSVFSGFTEIDDDFYDELEESLILADLGVETAVKATERLRKAIREQHLKTTDEAKKALKEILVDMLSVGSNELDLSTKPSVVLVIGVNGVGPKSALGILSALKPDALRLAVISGDAKAISKAPGVGSKTAQRIILDLKDKIKAEDLLDGGYEDLSVHAEVSGVGEVGKEAVEALTALGYSASEAAGAVRKVAITETMTAEDVLKAALRHLAFL